VNSNYAYRGEWTENRKTATSCLHSAECEDCGRCLPSGKGSRLIVLDAGMRDVGLIPDVGLIFLSNTNSGDYHDEMNHEHFKDWWENTFLPALPNPTTIVMDNAPYHTVMTPESRAPTTATKKEDMLVWLRGKGVVVTPDLTKAELLQHVRINRPKKEYIVDQLAMLHGHEVLRLPPKHCELNPIELIWGQMKDFVARNNTKFTTAGVQALFQQAKENVTPEIWNKCDDHVITQVEDVFWKIDAVQDNEVDRVIVQLDSDEEDEDEDDEDEDEVEQVERVESVEEEPMEEDDESVTCVVCCERDPPAKKSRAKKGSLVPWIQCDTCSRWHHVPCCKNRATIREDDIYICDKCVKIIRNK
jgi:transposase